MYKAKITAKAQAAIGYGKDDHEAVMDAWQSLSGVSSTDCLLAVYYQYANCDDLQYAANLFRYFDDNK
tara:strand:- start:216 stop:419 length:204 start_codon:yes stop_codon:yes gene_type:complete